METGVNIVCTLFLTGKNDWSIGEVANCKIKSRYPCTVSVLLPILARGARMVTSLPFSDVNKWRLTMLRVFELLRRNMLVLCSPFSEKRNILLCPCKKTVTWSCKINRIHYWCSVGIEKSQPEGPPFQCETRLAKFPTERWTRGLGFSGTTEHQWLIFFSDTTTVRLSTV